MRSTASAEARPTAHIGHLFAWVPSDDEKNDQVERFADCAQRGCYFPDLLVKYVWQNISEFSAPPGGRQGAGPAGSQCRFVPFAKFAEP
jgi:hypothetical protein